VVGTGLLHGGSYEEGLQGGRVELYVLLLFSGEEKQGILGSV